MAQQLATQDGSGASPPVSRVLTQALLAGLIAGFAAGVIDTVWSWQGMAQFAPSAIERIRAALFVGALYGLFGAALAIATALALWLLVRSSRLGDMLRAAGRAHRAARSRDPREALVGLSVAIALIPAVFACLSIAYGLALANLAARKHIGLMLASAMGLTLFALAAALIIALPLARLVELGLRAVATRPAWARALSAPRAPVYGLVAVLAATLAAGVLVSWKTLRLLELRPYWIALVAAVLVVPAWPLGRAWAYRLSARAPALRRAIVVAIPVILTLAVLSLGSRDAARQAALARTGLASPLTRIIGQLGDFDRDGYSRFLGGGDCDDSNPRVHPGARDVAGDGIDNNCVGGDAVATERTTWTRWPVPEAVPERPNVVLITIDTLRADHLGAYGYERDTSPNLDALAGDGALFANAWAHAPSTRYSIPAILTGRYPLEVSYFDIPRQWPGLATDNTMLAEVTQRRGLVGGAILNYWYFDKYRKMDQGFRHYDNSNKRLHRGVPGKGPAQTTGSSSKQQTDKAIELIDTMADQPFFLWVHYYDPHFAYESHKEVPSFGPGEIDRYDQEIRFTDLHIGRLIDHLRSKGLYDRTAVIVTGDHGEGFGEHGIDLHGYHLYAAQTRVPLIIRVPGIEPTTVTMPAGHVDIVPTVANLLGSSEPKEAMGKSLIGAMTGADDDQGRIVFQQLSYENNNEMRGAASALCHVIYNVSPHSSWEVYRIDRDPGETRNLSADPGPCGVVVDQLALWYDETEAARRGRP